MGIQSYKDIIAWQKAIDLAKKIYFLTSTFPKEELYGITSQMRRAAVSVPSNIAEGQQRRNTKEFLQFIGIAQGSLAELDTQLIIAESYYKIDQPIADQFHAQIVEIQKMLAVLASRLCDRLRH